MQELKYRPLAYWLLDSASPYRDYTGYNQSATSAAGTTGLALSSVAAYSQVFSKDRLATFVDGVFKRNTNPFTLAAAVCPVTVTMDQKVQTYRENYAPNPTAQVNTVSFDSQEGTTSRDTSIRLISSGSFKVTRTATGTDTLRARQITNMSVTPGETVTGAVWVYLPTATRTVTLELFVQTLTTTIYPNSGYSPMSPAGWNRLVFQYIVPEDGVAINSVQVIATGIANGESYYVDGYLLTHGTDSTYIDGSMPGQRWVGTPFNSKSYSLDYVSRVNLFSNPNATTTGTAFTYPLSTEWSVDGGTSVKVTGSGTTGSNDTSTNVVNSDIGEHRHNMKPGRTYTVSATGYVPNAFTGNIQTNRDRRIVFFHRDGNGNYQETRSPQVPIGAATKVSVTVTVPLNATESFVRFYNGSDKTTDIIYWDQFMIEESPTINSYFDGTTLGSSWSSGAATSASYMLTSTGNQTVLSHGTTNDGLTINGTIISFATVYATTGEARCSYDMEYLQNAHVVGTHTATKNTLYVNGEAVAEVDITAEQQGDQFLSLPGTLNAGYTMSSQRILMNSVALYNNVLRKEDIEDIYKFINHRAVGSVSRGWGGEDIGVSRTARKHFLTRIWDKREDWNTGVHDGTTPDGEDLVAQRIDDVTVQSTYTDSLGLLNNLNPDPLDSLNIDWTGKNVTMQASLDETNWVDAVRGRNLSIIPTGYVPTGGTLFVRASFPAGKDEAYLSNFRVDGYLDGVVIQPNARTMTFQNAVNLKEHSPYELSDDWGAKFNNGLLTFGADTSPEPNNFKTIEIWVKNQGSFYLSPNFPASPDGVYVDGVPGYQTKIGQWTVYHYVFNSGITGSFYIGGTMQIGKVSLFANALSASDVAWIVDNYTGVYTASAGTNNGAVGITESTESVKIYSHDWAIETAI